LYSFACDACDGPCYKRDTHTHTHTHIQQVSKRARLPTQTYIVVAARFGPGIVRELPARHTIR
jgi:hypothetical protein